MGYDIMPTHISSTMARQFYDLLSFSQANFFIDVGANEGQSALEYFSYQPLGQAASFEPLIEAHQVATEKSKSYPNWTVYPRMALGENEGEVEVHVSKNSVSSSLLKMNSLHLSSAPDSTVLRSEVTPMKRLDQALLNRKPEHRYYLKIDTQGYEMNVLKGATQLLDNVVAIQLELSWQELYAGQTTAQELITWLQQHRFQPYGFSSVFRDHRTHALLQSDGYFIRS